MYKKRTYVYVIAKITYVLAKVAKVDARPSQAGENSFSLIAMPQSKKLQGLGDYNIYKRPFIEYPKVSRTSTGWYMYFVGGKGVLSVLGKPLCGCAYP